MRQHKAQAILKALIVVLIIKMAVSPYSPIGAYVAVSFQGLFGALLFTKFSWKGITLAVLGIVTFLQSALQKLLILTIIYGTEIWEAIDIYGQWVQQKLGVVSETSTSTFLILLYLSVYSICGVLAGLFIKSIIHIISRKKEEDFYLPEGYNAVHIASSTSKFKTKAIWFWFLIVLLIVIAFSFFGNSLFGWKKGIYVLIRSFLILMVWYLILGPVILKLIRTYLQSKKSQYQEDISSAMDLFPYFRQILLFTWRETQHLKGYNRFKYFIADSISNCIHFKSSSK